MFDRVVELQDRIMSVVACAERVLLDGTQRDVAALGRVRWELTRLLREYQLFKHTMIFDRFAKGGDARARKAELMRAQCVRCGEEFRAFVLRWTGVSILDEWDVYQPAALAAIGKVRSQLAKERIGVAELLGLREAA